MPERFFTHLPRITVSSLQDISCSKRFRATRIERTAWADREPMPVIVPRSSAWHEVLHMIHLYRVEDGTLPLRDLDLFVRQAVLHARYERDADRKAEMDTVRAMTMLFLDSQDEEDVRAIFALEAPAEFDFHWRGAPMARMSARLDRLLVRADNSKHLVLQDFKSGARKISLSEAFLQLWCSKVTWPDFESFSLENIWVDLEDGTVDVDVITTDMVSGQQRYLIGAAERAIRGEPVAEAGPWCTFCNIRKKCQAFATVRLEEGELVF